MRRRILSAFEYFLDGLCDLGVVWEAGRGMGAAVWIPPIDFGMSRARVDGASVLLEAATARNVPLHERIGFRVVEDTDAPDGGPHMWFMRWDP